MGSCRVVMWVYFAVARSLGFQRSAMTIKMILLLLVMVPSPLSTHVVALYLCTYSSRIAAMDRGMDGFSYRQCMGMCCC